jgi:hypothetical protein
MSKRKLPDPFNSEADEPEFKISSKYDKSSIISDLKEDINQENISLNDGLEKLTTIVSVKEPLIEPIVDEYNVLDDKEITTERKNELLTKKYKTEKVTKKSFFDRLFKLF